MLALLRDGAAYGFDIARHLTRDGVLMASEGTLYPLLSRLRKAGLVDTTWQESTSGPPRRYYELTDSGARALEDFTATWQPFRDAVDAALSEGATS